MNPIFRRAEHLLRNPEELLHTMGNALRKAYAKRAILQKVLRDFLLLFRFVRAWVRGDYREMPSKSVYWAIFAIVYFLSPIDLIPDFLPGGYIDDIFVIAWVCKKIRKDLDQFLAWEAAQVLPAKKEITGKLELSSTGKGETKKPPHSA